MAGSGETKTRKIKRSKMPHKRTINLVTVDEKKVNGPMAILGIFAIVVFAALFSKFFVVDRLNALSEAENLVAQKKASLQTYYDALIPYEGLEDSYAHYTYDGMTQEELGLVPRTKIMTLVGKIFKDEDQGFSWSVSGNILSIDVTRESLEALNKLAIKLEKSEIVDTCSLMTASKSENRIVSKMVSGRYTVYLKMPSEEEEEESS